MPDNDYTVGDLKRQLAIWDDDTKLTFGGGVTFYRVKRCGDDEVYIEWNEAQAYLDDKFRKKNPHIQVAFVRSESVEWQEGGVIGSVDVSIR